MQQLRLSTQNFKTIRLPYNIPAVQFDSLAQIPSCGRGKRVTMPAPLSTTPLELQRPSRRYLLQSAGRKRSCAQNLRASLESLSKNKSKNPPHHLTSPFRSLSCATLDSRLPFSPIRQAHHCFVQLLAKAKGQTAVVTLPTQPRPRRQPQSDVIPAGFRPKPWLRNDRWTGRYAIQSVCRG